MMRLAKVAPVLGVILILAGSFLVETAFAEKSGRSDVSMKAEYPAAWHQRMCTERYTMRVGCVAYLEAKLHLANQQKAVFDNWKDRVLANAKSRKDTCEARTFDKSHPPTILNRQNYEREALNARLAALDAQRPTLEALYQVLTPEQRTVLDRLGRHRPHEVWRQSGHDRQRND